MPFFRSKQTPPADAVKTTVKHDADGDGVTVTQSFTLKPGSTRPVRDEVVEAYDAALGALGGEVMHAIDPSRVLGFQHGGPAVWSVGLVDVKGPHPYTLLLTYGFSHTLSPEAVREGHTCEYSLAVPADSPLSPWAVAFVRYLSRYSLTQAPLKPNDCMPMLRGTAISRAPFPLEQHPSHPDSPLVGVICTVDPVLPVIDTPHGQVEVRRLVGIDQAELDRAETWSFSGFNEELLKADPLLRTPLERKSHMDDALFRNTVNLRAAKEGNAIDAALFDVRWERTEDNRVLVHLPDGRAAKRLLDGLEGRLRYRKKLFALSMSSPPILFDPESAETVVTRQGLLLAGRYCSGVVNVLRLGGGRTIKVSLS